MPGLGGNSPSAHAEDYRRRFKQRHHELLHQALDYVETELDNLSTEPMADAEFRTFISSLLKLKIADAEELSSDTGLSKDSLEHWDREEGSLGLPARGARLSIVRLIIEALRGRLMPRVSPCRTATAKDPTSDNLRELPSGVLLPRDVPVDTGLRELPGWGELSIRTANALCNSFTTIGPLLSSNYPTVLQTPNFGKVGMEELLHWCLKHGMRGRFFDHPKAQKALGFVEPNRFSYPDGISPETKLEGLPGWKRTSKSAREKLSAQGITSVKELLRCKTRHETLLESLKRFDGLKDREAGSVVLRLSQLGFEGPLGL